MVLKEDHGQLGQNDLIQPCCVDINLLPLLIVLVNGVLLDYVQEVGIGDPHKDLLNFLLGVEPTQTGCPVLIGFFLAETKLVDLMTHIQHSFIDLEVL